MTKWSHQEICRFSRNTGAYLGDIGSYVNTEAMGLHLTEISKAVAVDGHALLIADGAGWHDSKDLKVSDNITILKLGTYMPKYTKI